MQVNMNPILDGLLLGDGTIEPHREISGRLSVRRKIAHAEYNHWLVENLPEFRWANPKEHYSVSHLKGRLVEGHQHMIRTSRDRRLAEVRRRWYPDGHKHVPKDLRLTPTSLAVWYMDDGSLGASVIKGHPGGILHLYSSDFIHEEVQFLRQQIVTTFGVLCSIQRDKRIKLGYRIVISGNTQVRRFLQIVVPTVSQVPCMCYKLALDDLLDRKRASIVTI